MKKTIEEYNILKFIAIIFVVLSHSTYYKITSNYGGINYQNLINNNFCYYIKVLIRFERFCIIFICQCLWHYRAHFIIFK